MLEFALLDSFTLPNYATL